MTNNGIYKRWLDPNSDIPDNLRKALESAQHDDLVSADKLAHRLTGVLVPMTSSTSTSTSSPSGLRPSGPATNAAVRAGGWIKLTSVIAIAATGIIAWKKAQHEGTTSQHHAAHTRNVFQREALHVPLEAGSSVGAPQGIDIPSTQKKTRAHPSHPLRREAQMLDRARAMLGRDPRHSALLAARHERKHSRSVLSEEREWIWIQAEVNLGNHVEASARARRFRERFPSSPYLPQVNAMFGVY